SARSVMRPAQEGADYAGEVAPGDKVVNFAAQAVAAQAPLAVRDRRGRLLGQIEREAVIEVLAEAS
ncbi:MAG: glycine betaine/L-proline ABC transporter ATP-binding protein, partial [Pseudomonadota bacterium]